MAPTWAVPTRAHEVFIEDMLKFLKSKSSKTTFKTVLCSI